MYSDSGSDSDTQDNHVINKYIESKNNYDESVDLELIRQDSCESIDSDDIPMPPKEVDREIKMKKIDRKVNNLDYIFDPKFKFNANEQDYDFPTNAGNFQKRNIKSPKVPVPGKIKSKSKTKSTVKKAKDFFEKRQKNHKIIINEHATLQQIGLKYPTTCGSHSLNDVRNRYATAVPFDYNRVKIQDIFFESETDYINASYVNSFDRHCAFIVCQNPLEHTVKDFWVMIYENKSKAIFSLVNYENRKSPVERYWPPENTVLEYEEFEVHALKKSKLGKIVIRDFEIIPTGNMPALKVRHFNYSEWSDMRGVPNMSEIGLLVKNAREFVSNENCGPVVVHCNSGTGRSGVFLACIMLSDQIDQFQRFDMFRTCSFIKEQRKLTFKDLPAYLFLAIYCAKYVSLTTNPNNESLYTL